MATIGPLASGSWKMRGDEARVHDVAIDALGQHFVVEAVVEADYCALRHEEEVVKGTCLAPERKVVLIIVPWERASM